MQALALAMAKLTQESCCIAICRIALKLDDLDDQDRAKIAQIFTVMLNLDDEVD
eukprot:gene26198-34272_t